MALYNISDFTRPGAKEKFHLQKIWIWLKFALFSNVNNLQIDNSFVDFNVKDDYFNRGLSMPCKYLFLKTLILFTFCAKLWHFQNMFCSGQPWFRHEKLEKLQVPKNFNLYTASTSTISWHARILKLLQWYRFLTIQKILNRVLTVLTSSLRFS